MVVQSVAMQIGELSKGLSNISGSFFSKVLFLNP